MLIYTSIPQIIFYGLKFMALQKIFVYQACNFANQPVKIGRGSDCVQGIDPDYT